MSALISKFKNGSNLVKNMGWRYTGFRVKHEFLKRSGLLKKKFPQSPSFRQYISISEWKEQNANFFFHSKEELSFEKRPSDSLKEWFEDYTNGRFLFFNSTVFDIGSNYNWLTNPDTGFMYNAQKHWTEIPDYSKEAGDIKYVWEKSRFGFLYNIIRYDYHFNKDCSAIVFDEILSWIKSNPINSGPNYVCSQETSLRILNWTFALYYYKNSDALTQEIFNKIQFSIYWQIHHVYNNIQFSRIAVRNNHAITETLTLYLTGLLYPKFPGSKERKEKGKAWFEKEIEYQVYDDGTYLQFSMNYHRVVVQLLTWAIILADKNDEKFKKVVYERAKKSIEFLRACMNDSNGWLPNYGANDGALFFPLNNGHFRNYKPQLQALANALNIDAGFNEVYEDERWYNQYSINKSQLKVKKGINEFKTGGYYIIREEDTLTFIRCGSYKDRPSHADNLQIDIWYRGENIIADAGSYKYNTDEKTLKYFMGTASHNTVMLDDYDQMHKGSRFIWYHWTKCLNASIEEDKSTYKFNGEIFAFSYIKNDIKHKREIIKIKNQPIWFIKDEIINKPANFYLKQLWHLPKKNKQVEWKSFDEKNEILNGAFEEEFISNLYGHKEIAELISFKTLSPVILTELNIKSTE
ncbi:MAG: alginate lyase family protein [Parafilimonas sp.]